MKNIKICDRTLCTAGAHFSFKEKIEIARQLERLNVNAVELPEIENAKTDTLLVRTVASFVKNSVLSVCGGKTRESIDLAADALRTAAKPRIRIELPLSTVGMEYICHKKAPKMGEFVTGLVGYAKEKCSDTEFCAMDATRADKAFLYEMIDTAIAAGAGIITISDDAAEQMPDEFAAFIAEIAAHIGGKAEISVMCSDKNGLASASSVMAVKQGADSVKTAVSGDITSLEGFAAMIKNCGDTCRFSSGIKNTELNRIVKQIVRITGGKTDTVAPVAAEQSGITLDGSDGKDAVVSAAASLGYDLSDEDAEKVYEEFRRVAAKKRVGAKELEVIITSTAMQAPPTYTLVNYVINNGNIISASAQVTLERDGKRTTGISIGDGPIDAAFLALEQIIGSRYELEDFKIETVTEGKESIGSALVKLRFGGKLYSGNGISTDIIGASIRAYINAVNKIVYGEA